MKTRFYVIAIKNNFTATGYEYFNVDRKENKLFGYHNPISAILFQSVSEANKFIKQFITFKDVEVLPFKKEADKFKKWLQNGCLYRSLPAKNLKLSRKYNNESKEEILKWHIAKAKSDDFEIDQEDWESWPELYEKFKYLHSVHGFENGTITFEFSFPKSGEFNDFKKELALVSPYCTCKDGTGKLYNVFDHYLGEGGNSVSLVGYKDNSFCVKSQFSIRVSGTLEDCFEYLKKEHWYGD